MRNLLTGRFSKFPLLLLLANKGNNLTVNFFFRLGCQIFAIIVINCKYVQMEYLFMLNESPFSDNTRNNKISSII